LTEAENKKKVGFDYDSVGTYFFIIFSTKLTWLLNLVSFKYTDKNDFFPLFFIFFFQIFLEERK